MRPPRRSDHESDRCTFHAYMMLPGLSDAFHSATLNRSLSSVATYRSNAKRASGTDPAVLVIRGEMLATMRAEDGLAMAQLRGRSQMPYWSRLAICEYRKRGYSRRDIASAFRCSLGTVANILRGSGTGYGILSGERQLTGSQQCPRGKWSADDR